MSFIAFQQPDPNMSDQLMQRVLRRGDGRMTSSRLVDEETIPGGPVWAYVPTDQGVECVAYQWGRIMRNNWYPDMWTMDISDAPSDWREEQRIALVPIIGTWHWPMGMNQRVLHAVRKTRKQSNHIREDRQLKKLADNEPFKMVYGVRGNSYRIVRERRQPAKWMPCHCLLILTEQSRPIEDPEPVATMEKFLDSRTGQVLYLHPNRTD